MVIEPGKVTFENLRSPTGEVICIDTSSMGDMIDLHMLTEMETRAIEAAHRTSALLFGRVESGH